MSLQDELMEIKGIGPKKAEEIEAVVATQSDHHVATAYEKLQEGKYRLVERELEKALE
jgi:ERCC4-type nuclease